MRVLLRLAIAVVVLCLPGMAQNEHLQLFGGYSLFVNDSNDLRRFGPVLDRLSGDPEHQTLHGWDTELSLHLTNLISVVGDVSGHYQTARLIQFSKIGNLPNINIDVTSHIYNFLAGPRVSFTTGPLRPFAHVLVGLSRTTSHSSIAEDSLTVTTVNDNNFALALGGGFDLPVGHFLSIRPVKLDYIRVKTDPNELTAFTLNPSPSWTNNLRYSAGVVFRF